MITNRIKRLRPSATLVLGARVKALKKQGQHICDLTLGEPDFVTPLYIQEAGIQAIRDGFTHYTGTAGIIDLREAICQKLSSENGLDYESHQVVVGVGSKQLLYHALQVLCEAGDEVLLPIPTWGTYSEQIILSEARPVFVEIQAPFILRAADLIEHITPRTKVLLLNSPSNPTGAIIPQDELSRIAEVVLRHNLVVISDEIYEKLTYGDSYCSIASLGEDIKARVVTINGFSKAYAMTGWRVGYAVGPAQIIEGMISLQSQTTSNTCSISQVAALAALRGPQDSLLHMKQEYRKRRDVVCSKLADLGLSFVLPDGGLYVFVDIRGLLHEDCVTSQIWCEQLLERTGVAVVPGEAFHAPGFFRLSFTQEIEELELALHKIGGFIV